MPPASLGAPDATWARPSPPTSSADQPITIRAVAALLSGWRRNRTASRASSSGTVHDPDPKNVTTKVDTGLIGPATWNQVAAAPMIAAHRHARPRPSR